VYPGVGGAGGSLLFSKKQAKEDLADLWKLSKLHKTGGKGKVESHKKYRWKAYVDPQEIINNIKMFEKGCHNTPLKLFFSRIIEIFSVLCKEVL
jgi:hypothetical protein